MLGAGIVLCVAGALVLALAGITEETRIIVTPCFTFGLMFIAFGTQRTQEANPEQERPNQPKT